MLRDTLFSSKWWSFVAAAVDHRLRWWKVATSGLKDGTNRMAFPWTAECGHEQVAPQLVERGSQINAQGRNCSNALHSVPSKRLDSIAYCSWYKADYASLLTGRTGAAQDATQTQRARISVVECGHRRASIRPDG